jgi:hypothetical protein
MSQNNDILSKYKLEYDSVKNVSFPELKEDFLKIKPINIPIYDILTMKYIGEYIDKFANHQKWLLYDRIDMDIIDLCKKNWDDIKIDYIEIIKIILNGKLEMKHIGNLKHQILDYIDKIYKRQYMIKDNDTINSAHLQMKYLDFRLKFNNEISEIFDKNIIETNQIDLQIEEFMEQILENFKDLETSDNFSIATELLDKVENIINEKIKKLIKEEFEEYKKLCMKQNEKSPLILHEIKLLVQDKFLNLMNDIYKTEFTKNLNHLDELIIQNLIELYEPQKKMHIIMLIMDIGIFDIQFLTKTQNQ